MKGRRNQPLDQATKAYNGSQSKVRVKVEHVSAVFKRFFGFTKVHYRKLNKNANALFVLCVSTILYVQTLRKKHRLFISSQNTPFCLRPPPF